jgi:hypothetical protein
MFMRSTPVGADGKLTTLPIESQGKCYNSNSAAARDWGWDATPSSNGRIDQAGILST